jgi:hypothetical protein
VVGTPSSTYPAGAISMRTDVPRAYLSQAPSTTVPARVQEAVHAGSYSVTLGSAPTAGNYLIAYCAFETSIPVANTGWTLFDSRARASQEVYMTLLYRLVVSGDSATQQPCSGTPGNIGMAGIKEVSGLDPVWANSYGGDGFAGSSTSGGITTSTISGTTSANSTLILAFGGWHGAAGTATMSQSGSGWSNTVTNTVSGSGASSVLATSQFFSTAGASYTSTIGGSLFSFDGVGSAVVLLTPPASSSTGAIPLSNLSTLKSAGSTITTDPRSLNFASGLSAADDGNGNTTASLALIDNTVTYAKLAQAPSDSLLGNFTGSTANLGTQAIPTCSGANDALTYNISTHALGCHAPSGAGGGTVTSVTCGTVTITGSGTCAPAMNQNLLVNGAMEIDQANEAASVSVTTGNSPYSADQWQVPFTGAATGLTVQQVADAPAGFLDSVKVTIGTGSATLNAGDSLLILQNIEGISAAGLNFGGANAQAVSLSFWIKSSITGTFGWALRNSANNRSYVGTFVVAAANTWQQVTVSNIGGDTSGTWLTATGVVGLRFSVTLMSGSTGQGTAGSWQASNVLTTNAQTNLAATSSNTFQLSGAKVEAGAFVTPYLRRAFGQELLTAQRYYEKTYDPGTAVGTLNAFNGQVDGYNGTSITNGTTIALGYIYKATKAKAPTVTCYRPRAANTPNTIDTNAASRAVTCGFTGLNSFGGPTNNTGGTLTALQLVEYQITIDARL